MSGETRVRPIALGTADAGFRIADQEMIELIDLIYRHSGIVLTPDKKSMVSSRLNKRLRANRLNSFEEYLELLRSSDLGTIESTIMIDEITTNKTDFFREKQHFEFIVEVMLPDLALSDWSVLNIWSAGCSTGEEPYTLAMILADYFSTGRNFNITATDLSTQALEVAQLAVYPNQAGKAIPLPFRQKYTLNGKGAQAGRFRIVPELRDRVRFKHLNLMDRSWDVPNALNMIFCRNVMIYFDKPTRTNLVSRFRRHLKSNGYLFIGHSESLAEMAHSFVQVRPTIYSVGR